MRYRRKMSRRISRKSFRRSSRIKGKNFRTGRMRGGYRL